jgi:hypothetical protein
VHFNQIEGLFYCETIMSEVKPECYLQHFAHAIDHRFAFADAEAVELATTSKVAEVAGGAASTGSGCVRSETAIHEFSPISRSAITRAQRKKIGADSKVIPTLPL